ncbi:hypothetical protein C0J52_26561 [Blattella germanica]|nr:hypothetical protein C0J52_26561 [Blattella germanica]
MIVNFYKCSNCQPFCSTHTRILLLTLSETPNTSAWSSALNGNMYADFLENILNQPKC